MKIINRKLKTLSGSIATFGEWGELPVRINIVSFETENDVAPDGLHKHQNGTETYFILSGSAIFEVDQEEVTLTPEKALVVSPGEAHRMKQVTSFPYLSVIVNSVNDQNDRVAIE